MPKKIYKEMSCLCGCGTNLIIRRADKLGYVRGHHKAWLGKKRQDMIGNQFGFKKGQTSWNKGKSCSDETKLKISLANKGKISPNKGKRMDWMIGENNKNWKGDKVGYISLHSWVKRWLIDPKKCEYCNSTKNLDWANKSHEYKRDLADWLRLCRSCHKKYDLSFLNTRNEIMRRFI